MDKTFWTSINNALASPGLTEVEQTAGLRNKGQLIIVGSGISSVRQMTIEALDYIQRADKVFYCTQDVTTEAFVQAHAKDHENIYKYYDTNKPRLQTYTQMAEVMLNSVRAGKLTVGILYGHPGVFVNPSHRAIYIARSEGYFAKMLPGISAEDCLYADLGIDPATTGCSMFEASLLIQDKHLIDPRHHVIIWQPGSVGKDDMVFDNSDLHQVADYLEPVYGADYPIIVYLCGMFPLQKSKIDHILIKDLRDAAKVKSVAINACSTFYIPPKTLPSLKWAGIEGPSPTGHQLLPTSAYRYSHPELPVADPYGDWEKGIIAELDSYEVPKMFKPLKASPAIRDVAIKVALLSHRLERLPQDAVESFILSQPGLSVDEKEALLVSGLDVDNVMHAGQRPPQSIQFNNIGPVFITVQNTIREAAQQRTLGQHRVRVVS